LGDEPAVRSADEHYYIETEMLAESLGIPRVLLVRVRRCQTRLPTATVVVDNETVLVGQRLERLLALLVIADPWPAV
jgi:hypothetical protein